MACMIKNYCRCIRCMDPTECGSLLSAIRCQECISNGKEETEGKVYNLLNLDFCNLVILLFVDIDMDIIISFNNLGRKRHGLSVARRPFKRYMRNLVLYKM